MNITFLLGNGFDIGIGLHTSYEDFYKEYIKIKSDDSPNIARFKKMLRERNSDESKMIIDWSDFEKAFGQHSSDFTIDQKDDYIERFEDFVLNFNIYLEDEEKRADFSNVDLISRTMNVAVTTYFHIRSGDREIVQNIYNSADRDRVYNFISFNYTKSVDNCAGILKQFLKNDRLRDVGKILHIHGFVEENMIMGVNDCSQITNEEFANDEDIIREIVKPRQNSDVRSNYERQVIETLKNSNIICVYGMSIGDTDKKWWKHICEWLIKSEKHILVILKYNDKYDKRFPFTQNKPIDLVINNFLELSEISENEKNSVRSRVIVGMNHNVFEMQLCEEEKLLNQKELINKSMNFLPDNG